MQHSTPNLSEKMLEASSDAHDDEFISFCRHRLNEFGFILTAALSSVRMCETKQTPGRGTFGTLRC